MIYNSGVEDEKRNGEKTKKAGSPSASGACKTRRPGRYVSSCHQGPLALSWRQAGAHGTGTKEMSAGGDGDGGDLGTAGWGRTGFGARHGRPDAGLSRGVPRRGRGQDGGGRGQDGGGGEDNPPAGVGGRDNLRWTRANSRGLGLGLEGDGSGGASSGLSGWEGGSVSAVEVPDRSANAPPERVCGCLSLFRVQDREVGSRWRQGGRKSYVLLSGYAPRRIRGRPSLLLPSGRSAGQACFLACCVLYAVCAVLSDRVSIHKEWGRPSARR